MNNFKHFVFHCNISVGAIFEGSAKTCRDYIISHPKLMFNSVIVDEDEYEILKHLSDEQVHKHFAVLEELAKEYPIFYKYLPVARGKSES